MATRLLLKFEGIGDLVLILGEDGIRREQAGLVAVAANGFEARVVPKAPAGPFCRHDQRQKRSLPDEMQVSE